MSSWHEGWVNAFDTETTGVNPYSDRIVTGAVAHIDLSGNASPIIHTWLSDPGVEIPAGATKIHGITTEQARAEGGPPGDNLRFALGQLGVAEKNGWPLVVMNARFDLPMLRHELARHLPEGEWLLPDVYVLDPGVIDRQLDKYRPGKRTLPDLCRRYGVNHGGAHDCTEDALAAARIVWRQAQMYPLVRMYSLQHLHAAQTRWAAEQAASLQAYFRSDKSKANGTHDPGAIVDPSWPILPEPAMTP
jgi:DNA polymerase III epsilon subunit-like protein